MKSLPYLPALALLAAAVAAADWPVRGAQPAQHLYWNGPTIGEWNTTASNWVTLPYDTDFRAYADGNEVSVWNVALFIGRDSIPIPVAPSNALFTARTLVHGGDIIGSTKVYIVDEESDVTFSNYAGGLSFTGGTFLRDEGTLIIDAEAMPEEATLWFGKGPISFDESVLRIISASPTRSIVLANDLEMEDGGLLDFSGCAGPMAIGGRTHLFSLMNFETGGATGGPPVTIAGPVQVGEPGGFLPAIWRSFGSYRDLVVQGSLFNEPGGFPEPLQPLELINYGRGKLRFTGVNTFTQGCYIVGHPLVRVDPAGTDYSIEVAAGSSLGTGDVRVETNALLRLLGSSSLHPSTRLTVEGSVYVATNVTVTCRELTLNGQTHVSGTFGKNNSDGHIFGPGLIHLECGSVGASVPPRLTMRLAEGPAPAGVVLSFTAAPCQSYQIEVTYSLAHPEWEVVATVGASADARPVTIPIGFDPFVRRRFFRTVSGEAVGR